MPFWSTSRRRSISLVLGSLNAFCLSGFSEGTCIISTDQPRERDNRDYREYDDVLEPGRERRLAELARPQPAEDRLDQPHLEERVLQGGQAETAKAREDRGSARGAGLLLRREYLG